VLFAAAVAVAAFAIYRTTLLPGVDFGDTPSFQVMAGSPAITPRDGYPLYFAIGSVFNRLLPGDPAHALNVASAAAGAVACGVIALVALELSGSLLASLATATIFGGSYTFWSQSVIAEVYALHILLVSGTLLLLLRWERQPTVGRLALFFLAYAAAFGNHLSMILFLPGFAVFLVIAAPGGWRTFTRRRIVGLAIGIAILGSLQYLWNLHSLWLMPQPPATLTAALQAFWFDVTKSDWRETMVFDLPPAMTLERLKMYGFDLRQQFGWLFPAIALGGWIGLARQNRRRAILIGLGFAANVLFALSYSVGDSHVFFLPSHLMIALLVAPGLVFVDRRMATRGAVMALAIAIAVVHIYREYPALDRSGDIRPRQVLDNLAAGLDDRNAVLLTDLNWQVQNGLNYYARRARTDLAVARMPDVLLYAPALFQDNRAIQRDIVVSERAADELIASYGRWFSVTPDTRVEVPTLSSRIGSLPKGTRYVLCVLAPSREFRIDDNELAHALGLLTGGSTDRLPGRQYVALGGLMGEEATIVVAADRPFRQATTIGGVGVDVRMESWLAFDTIRRMGFGQVIAGRRHALIVERGISFAAFDAHGEAIQTAYHGNIFTPQRRWLVNSR
jgi:hypothetical protein